MNLVSFVDELVKLSALNPLVKHAEDGGGSASAPGGMVGSGGTPDSIDVFPGRASTRIPLTHDATTTVRPGQLGSITGAKEPIDREKFNRWYRRK